MAAAPGLKGTDHIDPPTAATAAFPLSDLDKYILSISDEEYSPHTFSNLRDLIGSNSLHLLTRYPTQLKNYISWTLDIKSKWGTLNNYLLQNRLHWEPLPSDTDPPVIIFKLANQTPLQAPDDYKILPNDWPYGLPPGLTHVLIWLKHKLDVDDVRGDLTPESRALIERFVRQTFGDEERAVWWRNWTALQSVRGLDHVHVVVKGMSKDQLKELTGEDGDNIPGKPPTIAATKNFN